MKYIIFAFENDDNEVMYSAPLEDVDASYLEKVATHLRPLSPEDYMNGPAAILFSAAKHSYVLDGNSLYWCIEWDPGLIVVKFTPECQLSWTAIRSPIPNFGGREAYDSDWENYDEDAENPQYNLIFDPWDAQFDATEREYRCFKPADSVDQARFQKALEYTDSLGNIMEQKFSNNQDSWIERCQLNLEKWCGEGLRLV